MARGGGGVVGCRHVWGELACLPGSPTGQGAKKGMYWAQVTQLSDELPVYP